MKQKKDNHLIYFFGILICFFICVRYLYAFFLDNSYIINDRNLLETYFPGTVAKHIHDGLLIPFFDYQYSSYEGGGLVLGLFTSIVFFVFGPTSFSLVTAAIIFSTLQLILWIKFANKFYNVRTAKLMVLLLIFAPPFYTKFTILNFAYHTQVNLFILLFLYFFHNLYFEDFTERKNILQIGIMGLIAGLGTFFSYSFLVILFTCFLLSLSFDKKISLRRIAIFWGTFILGFSPALFRIVYFYSDIKKNIFDQLLGTGIYNFFSKWINVFFYQLPYAFNITSPIHTITYYIFVLFFLSLTFFHGKNLIFLIKGILPVKKFKLKTESIIKIDLILFFIFVYLSIYSFSRFSVFENMNNPLNYRYFFTIIPFMLFVIAYGLERLYSSNKLIQKIISILLILLLVICGLTGHRRQLNLTNYSQKIAERFKNDGFSYETFGILICSRFKNDQSHALTVLRSVESKYRRDAIKGFGFELSIVAKKMIPQYLSFSLDTEEREGFLQGILLGYSYPLFDKTRLGEAYPIILKNCSKKQSNDYFMEAIKYIQTLPQVKQKQCFTGLGIQAYGQYRSQSAIPPIILGSIPSSDRSYFQDGFKTGSNYFKHLTYSGNNPK